MDDIHIFMRSHPYYEEFEANVLKHRPNIPTYNPNEDNTENWKFESAKQEGFELCLKLFKIGD